MDNLRDIFLMIGAGFVGGMITLGFFIIFVLFKDK